jgi:hypothetical protein
MLYDLVSTNNLFKYFFPQLLQLESNLVWDSYVIGGDRWSASVFLFSVIQTQSTFNISLPQPMSNTSK